VADKNFKAFILSFFWGACFGFSIFPVGLFKLIDEVDVAGVVVTIYSIALAAMLLYFSYSFLSQNARDARRASGVADVWELLKTFGDEALMRFLPIQKTCTAIAWPGVDWSEEEVPFM
jgi:hypothetical protein